MKQKIIEILKEELYTADGYSSDEIGGIEKAVSRIAALLPTEEDIIEASEDHDRRSYCGHFDGDEPSLHWMAGVEWILSKIKTK